MQDKTKNIETIGKNIKLRREYLGFTEEDIAEYLHISKEAVELMEKDFTTSEFKNSLLEKLSVLFNCSIEYLLGEEPELNNATLQEITNLTKDLSDNDKSEILRFARYLKSQKS